MKQKQLVTIVEIKRHSLGFCGSRQMDITVETADGTLITVPWAKVPSMGTIPYKPTAYFDFIWHYVTPCTIAYLVHGNDANCNYLELGRGCRYC